MFILKNEKCKNMSFNIEIVILVTHIRPYYQNDTNKLDTILRLAFGTKPKAREDTECDMSESMMGGSHASIGVKVKTVTITML